MSSLRRQREREGRALVDAVAVRRQCPAEFPGSERAAVQPKTVAVPLRGEAVGENAGQVLQRDSHPGIGHRDLHLTLTICNAQRQPLGCRWR